MEMVLDCRMLNPISTCSSNTKCQKMMMCTLYMKASKRVAIIQSNYIPWKGYFNIIKDVDEFVLLDDVQYTRRDWRNRNLIKTQYGLKWLTIPVEVKGNYQIKIKDVYTAGADSAVSIGIKLKMHISIAPISVRWLHFFKSCIWDQKELI